MSIPLPYLRSWLSARTSGAIYLGVPQRVVPKLSVVIVVDRSNEQSTTLFSSSRINMFSGFKSRCTIFRSCWEVRQWIRGIKWRTEVH